jgi:glucose-6-phosphate-specific signal transduction histidine kinase
MGDVLKRESFVRSVSRTGGHDCGAHPTPLRTREYCPRSFPVILGSNSLMMALQELADNSANLFRVSCKFGCDGFVTVEDNIVATHLYRIAQEAVTNAVKHGGAKKILLRLAESEDKMHPDDHRRRSRFTETF